MEVADVNDGGDINLKKALEVGEANLPFLTTLKPRPHYNALLFLHKNVFFFRSKLDSAHGGTTSIDGRQNKKQFSKDILQSLSEDND